MHLNAYFDQDFTSKLTKLLRKKVEEQKVFQPEDGEVVWDTRVRALNPGLLFIIEHLGKQISPDDTFICPSLDQNGNPIMSPKQLLELLIEAEAALELLEEDTD